MRRQRGWIYLLTLLLLILAVASLTRLGKSTGRSRDELTTKALASAREALLAHAVGYGEMRRTNADPPGSTAADDVTLPPGTLPCPESANSLLEGAEASPCGSRGEAALGRLPWRSLGSGPLRDGDGNCLWYAVSGSFKANPPPYLLNWDTSGDFEIHDPAGRLIAADAIAVVFSPGPPLPGQGRQANGGECGRDPSPGAYLDSVSLDGVAYANASTEPGSGSRTRFIAGPVYDGEGRALVNDRLTYLTRDDLFARAIEKRKDFPGTYLFDGDDRQGDDPARYALAQKVAACLARYGRHNAAPADLRLPWAAPLAPGDFDNNSFDDGNGLYAGRPPYRVGTSSGRTGNTLVPPGCSTAADECRLLIVERCLGGWWRVAGKPLDADGNPRRSSPEGWWDRWKDHLFYIVAPEYAPNSGNDWSAIPNPCLAPGNRCLQVGNDRYAAAVIFGGRRLAGQVRESAADRGDPANYLEEGDAAAFAVPTAAQGRALTAAGNDRIVCIRPDLSLASDCR